MNIQMEVTYLKCNMFGVTYGDIETLTVFEINVPQNLALMASEVGLYEPLWNPTHFEPTPALVKGLETLRNCEYEGRNKLIDVAQKFLSALHKWPQAKVLVLR